MILRFLLSAGLLAALPACQPTAEGTGTPAMPEEPIGQSWAGIGPNDTLHFLGTEPFWGGDVANGTLTWKTPENQVGVRIAVSRFAGRNGLGFSGALDGQPFDLAVSQDRCSDGMSDRSFPYSVTIKFGAQTLRGCGWTDANKYSGPEQP